MSPRSSKRTLIALLALAAISAAGCQEIADLPRLTKKNLKFSPPESTMVYDRYGRLIKVFHGVQNRTIVPLKRIPDHVQKAVVAIEDERFYRHEGVDVRAIARAFLANIRSGEVREGGSTITQQYVKNVIIAPGDIAEKTLQRKVDEAALARQLEKKLDKDEILFRYLNTVYFGQGAYGIQTAAKTYFGRNARSLNLAQGALLAALIRSPDTYDPFKHRARARERRNLVLEKMRELAWADSGKIDKAIRSKVKLHRTEDTTRYPAPYFLDYLQRLIKYDPRFDNLGKTSAQREKLLFTGGLRIYTTVDLEMQAAADAAVDQVLAYPGDPHGALVAIEPSTGHIRAMVGGRDYFATRKENRFAKLNLATVAEPGLGPKSYDPVTGKRIAKAPGTGRQAGSAFKPFALAAGLRQGISLSDTYKASGEMKFPGADNGATWTVQNYEGSEFGTVSLLEATISSINVVYAQLILDVGPEAVTTLADAMGINTSLLAVPSAVLGANPVNALGMASAYSTFATNGHYHPPVAITRILDAEGKEIYRANPKPQEVLEPGISFLVTQALQKVITSGTGTQALGYLGGRPAAGKTGTAQEYRDAWFAGYTPDLAAAVWVGYPDGSVEMKTSCITTTGCRPTRIQVSGGTWPTEIWGAFMARALAGVPATAFRVPDTGLVAFTIDSRTGCIATDSTPDEFQVTSYYAPGEQPPSSCGTLKTAVPSVLGYTADEATEILDSEGFVVDVVTEPETNKGQAKKNSGKVWKQSPGSGTEVEDGSTVTIWVNP
jgi:penicillin-binding protein 1A